MKVVVNVRRNGETLASTSAELSDDVRLTSKTDVEAAVLKAVNLLEWMPWPKERISAIEIWIA